MLLGIGLGITVGGTQVDAAIRVLFQGGEQGFYFDPSDPSTVYQDAAGTTAGVVGQPLGKRLDKSGRGNNATQGTSASRPVWAQDGSSFYRDTFDGFDDSLSIAAGGGSTTGFFYCAGINVGGGAGTLRTLVSDHSATLFTGYLARVHTTNVLQFSAGNGASFTSLLGGTALNVGSSYVVTAWDDGVNLNLQVGQGAISSTARPVVAAGSAVMAEGKDANAATSFFNGSIYARMYRAGPPPNATQIAAIQRFIASRAGVTL